MSMMQAMQKYLMQCEFMELVPVPEVFEDSTSNALIIPEGSKPLPGTNEHQSNYSFFVRVKSEGFDFYKTLVGWLEKKKELPMLDAPYKARSVNAVNAEHFGADDTGSAIYQVQIALTYKKYNQEANKWLI